MITIGEFKRVIVDIMKSTYHADPSQTNIFLDEGEGWIDKIYKGQTIVDDKNTSTLSGGANFHDLVECASVILAVYELLKNSYEFLRKKKVIDSKEDQRVAKEENEILSEKQAFENEFRSKLEIRKVRKEIVDDIVTNYTEELYVLIERKSINQPK